MSILCNLLSVIHVIQNASCPLPTELFIVCINPKKNHETRRCPIRQRNILNWCIFIMMERKDGSRKGGVGAVWSFFKRHMFCLIFAQTQDALRVRIPYWRSPSYKNHSPAWQANRDWNVFLHSSRLITNLCTFGGAFVDRSRIFIPEHPDNEEGLFHLYFLLISHSLSIITHLNCLITHQMDHSGFSHAPSLLISTGLATLLPVSTGPSGEHGQLDPSKISVFECFLPKR